VRRPLRTIYELFRQKWWAIGFGVAAAAWTLHVIALKLAPLSLVQTTLASSFVFLGVFAERAFGMPLGRRQWLGIGVATAGLALLGVTAAHATPSGAQSGYGVAVAVAFEAGLVATGVAFILWPRLGPSDENGPSALLLAAAAGLLFTVSHIGIKAVAGSFSVGSLAWLPLIIGAFLGAFFGSARSLQVGDAVPVIAVTSAVSNASAIVGGILVFDDPIGGSAFVVAMRIAAFALVVLAAALIPAPVRAADPDPERVGESERYEQLEAAPERAAA